MKNKKAFTLVELMGVLVILGALAVILVPVINKTLKENKESLYDKQIKTIELAAKNFGSDNMLILPEENENVYVTLGQLKSLGYIEDVINPLTKEKFSDCVRVEIVKDDTFYKYLIDKDSFNSNNDNCKFDSMVSIGEPSRNFANKSTPVTYIVSISSDEETLKKYDVDDTKFELVGEASQTAKYSVVGENGIYKVTLKGGDDEGSLAFNLNDGYFIDVNGNELGGKKSDSITIDNTPPTTPYMLYDGIEYGNCYGDKDSLCSSNYSNALKAAGKVCYPKTYAPTENYYVTCEGVGCENEHSSFACSCTSDNCRGNQSCAILKLYACGDKINLKSTDNFSTELIYKAKGETSSIGCNLAGGLVSTEYGGSLIAVDEAGNESGQLFYSYFHIQVWNNGYAIGNANGTSGNLSYNGENYAFYDYIYTNPYYNPFNYFKIINGRWAYTMPDDFDMNNALPLAHVGPDYWYPVNNLYCPYTEAEAKGRDQYASYKLDKTLDYWYQN